MSFTFKCPNCGNEVIADDCKFCSKCGNRMEKVDTEPNAPVITQPVKAGNQKLLVGIIVAAIVGIIVLVFCIRFINQSSLQEKFETLLLEDAYDGICNYYADDMTIPHAVNNGGRVSFDPDGNVSFTANFKVIEFTGNSSDSGYQVTATGTATPNFFFTKYEFDYDLSYEKIPDKKVSEPQIETPATSSGADTSGSANTNTTSGTKYGYEDVEYWFDIDELNDTCGDNPFAFANEWSGKLIGVGGNIEEMSTTFIGNEMYITLRSEYDDSIFGNFHVTCYIYADDPLIKDLSLNGGAADIYGVVDPDHVSDSSIHLVDCSIAWAGVRETGFIE